jgi:L,D-peptidoglycan transpeptidase YkuD (ErfK/YbiS/YcfS/YnhG family)
MTRRIGLAGAAASLVSAGAAMAKATTSLIEVRGRAGETQGTLQVAGQSFACALGRSGIIAAKREGDGGTPVGRFPLRELRYRADRIVVPTTGLAAFPLSLADGWCDDPGDPAYNRLVKLPYAASHETLTRDDHLYDALVVIGYNDSPAIAGRGSAIFLHVARGAPGAFEPTAGCVALSIDDLRKVLALCRPQTEIDIRLI